VLVRRLVMKTRLPAVAVLALVLFGCGSKKPIYTTAEKEVERAASEKMSLSQMFDEKARTHVMHENAQEHNAPYKAGYNVHGETVPFTSTEAVTTNIKKDWAEVVKVMDKGEPYDYVSLADLGQKLVMRGDELVTARRFELDKKGITPEKYTADETDRTIMRFGVLAKRFMLAAATRNLDELIEVYTVIPASTPYIGSGSY
jgi:hypothetical protein